MPFRRVAFFYEMQSSWLRNLFLRKRAQLFRAILSTAAFKTGLRDPQSRQKSSEMPGFCLPPPPKTARTCQLSYWEVLPKSARAAATHPNAASHHRCIQKHWILQKKNRRKSDGSLGVPHLSFSQLLDHKRNINVSTLWRSRA